MPSYEYECRDCKKEFTVYLSFREIKENPMIRCPHCESDDVIKKFTPFFAKTSKKS